MEILYFIAGVAFGSLVWYLAFARAGRVLQTGQMLPTVSKTGGVPHNPEEHARQQIMASSLEKAIGIQLEEAEAAGIKMTRKQAEQVARQMFTDAGLLGGING